jgi:hypothetical protein
MKAFDIKCCLKKHSDKNALSIMECSFGVFMNKAYEMVFRLKKISYQDTPEYRSETQRQPLLTMPVALCLVSMRYKTDMHDKNFAGLAVHASNQLNHLMAGDEHDVTLLRDDVGLVGVWFRREGEHILGLDSEVALIVYSVSDIVGSVRPFTSDDYVAWRRKNFKVLAPEPFNAASSSKSSWKMANYKSICRGLLPHFIFNDFMLNLSDLQPFRTDSTIWLLRGLEYAPLCENIYDMNCHFKAILISENALLVYDRERANLDSVVADVLAEKNINGDDVVLLNCTKQRHRCFSLYNSLYIIADAAMLLCFQVAQLVRSIHSCSHQKETPHDHEAASIQRILSKSNLTCNDPAFDSMAAKIFSESRFDGDALRGAEAFEWMEDILHTLMCLKFEDFSELMRFARENGMLCGDETTWSTAMAVLESEGVGPRVYAASPERWLGDMACAVDAYTDKLFFEFTLAEFSENIRQQDRIRVAEQAAEQLLASEEERKRREAKKAEAAAAASDAATIAHDAPLPRSVDELRALMVTRVRQLDVARAAAARINDPKKRGGVSKEQKQSAKKRLHDANLALESVRNALSRAERVQREATERKTREMEEKKAADRTARAVAEREERERAEAEELARKSAEMALLATHLGAARERSAKLQPEEKLLASKTSKPETRSPAAVFAPRGLPNAQPRDCVPSTHIASPEPHRSSVLSPLPSYLQPPLSTATTFLHPASPQAIPIAAPLHMATQNPYRHAAPALVTYYGAHRVPLGVWGRPTQPVPIYAPIAMPSTSTRDTQLSVRELAAPLRHTAVASEDDTSCMVCMDAQPDVISTCCQRTFMCGACARAVSRCPLCNSQDTSFIPGSL